MNNQNSDVCSRFDISITLAYDATMIRPYCSQDKDQCLRILREVGWMEGKESDGEAFDGYISDTNSFVTELDGEAEVLALTREGNVQYQDCNLPASFVTGVLTSRVSRMQGHALRTTAHALAQNAINGAAVSFLGIFDQGYYDKLGYGTLNYSRHTTIDPATLNVPKLSRKPKRYTKVDAEILHNCRLNRRRFHGSCNLYGVGVTGCELVWVENGFGLGFEEQSELTHCMWLSSKGVHGPYQCRWMAYQNPEQLVELLSVLKSLSDQIHGVLIDDPPGFQLQDFLIRPFANERIRRGGTFDAATRSSAWMQCRILDVEQCVGAMTCQGDPVSFNLVLSDPLEAHLLEDSAWKGVAGSWVIQLGATSSAIVGEDSALPTLSCSVNDLSRLWFGVASAESLVTVGQLSAEQGLIGAIDSALHLPSPNIDWCF